MTLKLRGGKKIDRTYGGIILLTSGYVFVDLYLVESEQVAQLLVGGKTASLHGIRRNINMHPLISFEAGARTFII